MFQKSIFRIVECAKQGHRFVAHGTIFAAAAQKLVALRRGDFGGFLKERLGPTLEIFTGRHRSVLMRVRFCWRRRSRGRVAAGPGCTAILVRWCRSTSPS